MNNGLTVGQAGGASISRSVCFEWSGRSWKAEIVCHVQKKSVQLIIGPNLI